VKTVVPMEPLLALVSKEGIVLDQADADGVVVTGVSLQNFLVHGVGRRMGETRR
jgi:hypothetical protein